MSNLTSGESSEPQRSVYDTCDPHYLRQLREASGMDWVVLARMACLSVAQVRQLETEGPSHLFYSEAIKHQAYKRLLMILGAEPPSAEVPAALLDAHKVAHAHLDTLDQIVAMSQQPPINHSIADTLREGWQAVNAHKQAMAALLFFVLATTLFVLHGPQLSDKADAGVVNAQSQASAAVPPASVPASVTPVAPAALPVASVAEAALEPVKAAQPPASAASLAPAAVSPASVPAAVVPVATSRSFGACEYSQDNLPQVTPFIANKEGRYVYVISTTAIDVCVVDGQKQATLLQLKAGDNRSVYGASPWQVSSSDLAKIQIYFQGGRVTLPEGARRVKLIEVPAAR